MEESERGTEGRGSEEREGEAAGAVEGEGEETEAEGGGGEERGMPCSARWSATSACPASCMAVPTSFKPYAPHASPPPQASSNRPRMRRGERE